MNIQLPDKSKYTEKIKLIQSILSDTVPNISRSVGSTLYEFLIRPISIVYAAVEDRIKSLMIDNSLLSLSESTNTEIGDVDKVLSNYFVYRNTGKVATALVMVYSDKTFTKIPGNTPFTVGDTTLISSETVCGVYPDTDGYTNTNNVSYVKAHKIGNLYCFTIQVATQGNSTSVIPAGVNVEPSVYIPGVEYAVLESPVEGGAEQETDAQMISRAKTSVCSWNGGSASIDKILKTSGLPVLSSASFGSSDREMLRVNNYPVVIGTQGMIDTYVRTCTYPLSGSVTISSSDLNSVHEHTPPGILTIDRVCGESGKNYAFDVVWGSSSDVVSDIGARFSVYQTVSIIVDNLKDDTLTINYTYIPYIKELQEYIQRPDVKLLGVDILIKAAIPSIVKIKGSMELGVNSLNTIKEAIKGNINNSAVGDIAINISHLNSYISNNYKGAYLVSPVGMQATSIGVSGDTNIISSVNGVLENSDYGNITRRMKFFCISDSGVQVE